VVAKYRATFVVTPADPFPHLGFYLDPPHSVYSLILRKGGHFVMTPEKHASVTFNGTWKEARGQIDLDRPKDQFVALVEGRDFVQGQGGQSGSVPTHTLTCPAAHLITGDVQGETLEVGRQS